MGLRARKIAKKRSISKPNQQKKVGEENAGRKKRQFLEKSCFSERDFAL